MPDVGAALAAIFSIPLLPEITAKAVPTDLHTQKKMGKNLVKA